MTGIQTTSSHSAKTRRARQHNTGKRHSFQWINGQIIAASEHGGLDGLLQTVSMHLEHMNLVNLSTAIHRLAKLCSRDHNVQAKLLKQPVLEQLLDTISAAFGALQPGEAQPQSLNNVAWSLATMRLAPRPLIQAMASSAVANINSFKPFELSTMLWAFAKLGASDGMSSSASWCVKPLFHASAAHILKHGHNFAFRCLATTAWAFATSRQRNARLFRQIATQMVPMVHAANCQEMANTAWAFGTADFHDDRLFNELADKALLRLPEFKPQELSNILWGFATNGFFHEAFFTAAAQVAVHQLDLQAQHLANILWSFARMRPRHHITQTTVLALLPACIAQLETFKPQEVSSTALAVAKAFGTSDVMDVDLISQEDVVPPPPPEVLEFFTSVMLWAVPRLHEFSAQSLANTVNAYTMVNVPGVELLFTALSTEVYSRYETLEPSALLHLLKGFASVPSFRSVAQTLAAGISPRIDELRPQEAQALAKICASMLGLRHELCVKDLNNCCAMLGDAAVGGISDMNEAGAWSLQQVSDGFCMDNGNGECLDPVQALAAQVQLNSIEQGMGIERGSEQVATPTMNGATPKRLDSITELHRVAPQVAMLRDYDSKEMNPPTAAMTPKTPMTAGVASYQRRCSQPSAHDQSPNGAPFAYSCSLKNTFLHVSYDGREQRDVETMEDGRSGCGSSARSSSVPSRLGRGDEDCKSCEMLHKDFSKKDPNLHDLGFNWGTPTRKNNSTPAPHTDETWQRPDPKWFGTY